MNLISINNKKIGNNEPCFIIAEAGVNHNGSLKMALKLVDAAKKAGADAIKFQTFKAEDLVTARAESAEYVTKNMGKQIKQMELLKNLELQEDDFILIKKECDKKDIIFLSTPHTFSVIDFLDNLIPAYKIASSDMNNHPFLEYIAKKKKPIILGTGMSTMDEVQEAIQVIKSARNNQIIVMHCTTSYPCPLNDVNLRAMITIKKKLNCIIGYSDHTSGILVSLAAVAIGAKVIEKHFTLNKNLDGPDHISSIEPKELATLIHSIRDVELSLGSADKKPVISELKIKNVARKSIVAKQNIPLGTVIKRNMLTIKRPGTGIEPKYFDTIIGQKSKKDILKDEIIYQKYLE